MKEVYFTCSSLSTISYLASDPCIVQIIRLQIHVLIPQIHSITIYQAIWLLINVCIRRWPSKLSGVSIHKIKWSELVTIFSHTIYITYYPPMTLEWQEWLVTNGGTMSSFSSVSASLVSSNQSSITLLRADKYFLIFITLYIFDR